MAATIIAMEAVSLAVLIIIFCGCIFEISEKSRKNNLFNMLVFFSIISELVDMLAWVFNGNASKSSLIFGLNLASFILGYIVAIVFNVYLLEAINEKRKLPRVNWYIIGITGLIAVIYVLNGAMSGNIFYIEAGSYIVGSQYAYTQIFTIFVAIDSIILSLYYRKTIGRHDTIVFLVYSIFPGFTILLHFVFPAISLSYVAAMLSILILYVMLQAEQRSEFKIKEQILLEYSMKDSITQVENARAFDAFCDNPIDNGNIGIVYIHMSGLNDISAKFGHEEAEKHLLKFAEVLKKYFEEDRIFKLNGNEFVVAITEVSRDRFDRMVEDFNNSIVKAYSYTIIIGANYGKMRQIKTLVKSAEEEMYEHRENVLSTYF